ncbi:hypothetical protein E2C01_003159 [Portunus trituberculatus]|uniref:Uncharacterized protein n=1 Tax=Portunus trituberculatus TaxID=210409 RepID=A0A5B7CLG3_PORTR|nr:hypothetical protein [Portunus trituberculatus]
MTTTPASVMRDVTVIGILLIGAEGLNVRVVNEVNAVQIHHLQIGSGRLQLVHVDHLVDLFLLLVRLLIRACRGTPRPFTPIRPILPQHPRYTSFMDSIFPRHTPCTSFPRPPPQQLLDPSHSPPLTHEMQHLEAVDEVVDLAHETLHEDDLRQTNAHRSQPGRKRLQER